MTMAPLVDPAVTMPVMIVAAMVMHIRIGPDGRAGRGTDCGAHGRSAPAADRAADYRACGPADDGAADGVLGNRARWRDGQCSQSGCSKNDFAHDMLSAPG